MKMKKITLGSSLLLAASLMIVSCNKKTNEAPVADLDFKSAQEASFANSAILDIETIVSYAADNQYTGYYFAVAPGSPSNAAITASNNTTSKILTINYTNSVVCMDGKRRNGEIVIDYSLSNQAQGADFYRRPGFVGKVTLNNYWVDGIVIDDAAPFVIKNTTPFNFSPSATNQTWTMDGYFSVRNENYMQDSSQNRIWKGILTKTLLNTAEVSANQTNPINWVVFTNGQITNAAKVAYTGTVTGVTSRVVSYSFEIDEKRPERALYRDFKCSPDPLLSVVTTPSYSIQYSQWHPIIGGTAKFVSLGAGTAEPRVLTYGADGGATPCDNAGTVTIKGITYQVDFKK